ncbi:hypothetical protein AHMF7605_08425 [Adhaeribacter arboris]|uniref:Glycoside hydrolase family 5 domain-containing protein n=1 Tax=Adhaeribacter arboris TaxID=2072846 RepID=A0A2T2YDK6_9BACT|nr:cellulase family glycosylhydrolase [Adhaeribacter arboris]PSR53548.1 hypothetical protein AHMF7605_08425 [Adhaeribacter arboris]
MQTLYFFKKSSRIKNILFISVLLLIGSFGKLQAQEAPFRKGINLTNWFQAASVREVQINKYTRKDFEQIKSLGCDVIRLPINLHYMTSGAPNYTLEPLFFQFLDQPVQWAEELNLHLILDNHTFDPIANTPPDIEQILKKVWPQVAQHYRNRSNLLYYEVLNEPHGISATQWNAIQQKVINAIRAVDTQHTIIVGATNFNSYQSMAEMPVYPDTNLIYTFHFYDPFLFTHQGASWVEPSMEPLAQMPFPYQATNMPALPATLKNTWLESAYNQYSTDGTVAKVKEWIDVAANFKNTHGVKVFCGEFGVLATNSPSTDRVNWYQTVRSYLEEKNIAWTTWDYHGGFGLFKPGGNDLFHHDLNIPLLTALGFNLPPQTDFTIKPDTVGFLIYDDYLGAGLSNESYGSGNVNFYSPDLPNNGNYSISWAKAEQYNSISLNFKPDKDLSELRKKAYALDFFVRGTAPGVNFDLRFIDTKTTAPNDHPWRAVITLDAQKVSFDGRWHHLHIPLTDFAEQGAWDNNQWYNPEGKFDWRRIDRLEITSEHAAFNNNQLWFDNVYLTDQDTAQVRQPGTVTGTKKNQNKSAVHVYPNPARNHLTIKAETNGKLTYEILDNLGRVLLRNSFQSQTEVNILTFPAGVYLVKLTQTDHSYTIHRMVKVD